MIRLLTLIALLAALATSINIGTATAASIGPWVTDEQAAAYVEKALPGIDGAYAINGYYSAHEKRTGRHYGQRTVVTPRGYVHYKFRSFAVSAFDSHGTRQFYVQTRTNGHWIIQVDRGPSPPG